MLPVTMLQSRIEERVGDRKLFCRCYAEDIDQWFGAGVHDIVFGLRGDVADSPLADDHFFFADDGSAATG